MLLTPYCFLAMILVFGLLILYIRIITVNFHAMGPLAFLWMFVFAFLIMNVARMFVCSLYTLLFPPPKTPERFLSEFPRTAILYTVRAESCGLFERMEYTFRNNYCGNVDLWIASGDAPESFLAYELSVLRRLQRRFGEERVKRFHVSDPAKKKREMMEQWLKEHGHHYRYFVNCDGDSLLPENFLLKLLRKAAHPANRDVAIFQASIRIANAKTHYSHLQVVGNRIGLRLYVATEQNAFGRGLYWGHNALVRIDSFIGVSIPPGVLSHDIWETAYLDKAGQRTVFCPDVVSFEEAPANYLESRKRSARWAKGTLQSWKLIFDGGISLPSRFYVFDGVYSYLSNLIFLGWVYFGIYLEKTSIWSDMVGMRYITTCVVLSIVFLHKLAAARGVRDVLSIFHEIFISTILSMNNLFYTSLALLQMPFHKKSVWVPMKKDPRETLSFKDTFLNFWPSTALGVGSTFVAFRFAPQWGICSIPMLASFLLSIPTIYFTAKIRTGEL
ncbi:MAG: hypothetical protein IPP35_09325 [Elusimicrobia bacterium]|nr:hypothetical protein [Elusimicrobiota bacterium]